MGAKSRNKGAAFEREVARLIHDWLGIEVRRNLSQYQERGLGDLVGWDGVVIECKRHAFATRALIDAWWRQTVAEARKALARPVLVYKADRQPVRVVVALGDLSPSSDGTADGIRPVEMDMETFAAVAREAWV